MCDFHNLSDEEKLHYHKLLLTCANNFGGLNFFLQLIESLRASSAHPLCSRHQDFLFDLGTIRWGKVIFNDKVQFIETMRKEKHENGNFLPKKDSKNHKRTLNLIRTLSPIIFSVRPSRREDGEGFDFKAFDIIDNNITKLNPIFDALFFCSIGTVKTILEYKA
jgi:hypothetical protein